MLLSLVLIFFLAFFHLVASLFVNRLLQNLVENLFGVRRNSLLLDVLFDLLFGFSLALGLSFSLADALVALELHVKNLLVDLLFLRLFIFFVTHIVHLGGSAADQVRPTVGLRTGRNFSLLEMVENRDFTLLRFKVDLSLADLLARWLFGVLIQIELLSELFDCYLSPVITLG